MCSRIDFNLRGALGAVERLPEDRLRFGLTLVAERGVKRVRANKSGCFDQCEKGAAVVVYPNTVWYGGVTEADVAEIVEEHIIGGRPGIPIAYEGKSLMEAFLTADGLIALVTLTVLEVVLGIDNVIFISILAAKLPPKEQERARRIGLMAAMSMRIALLASIARIVQLTAPLFTVLNHPSRAAT